MESYRLRLAAFLLIMVITGTASAQWGGTVEAESCGRFTIAPGGGEDLVDPAAGNDYRVHVWVTFGGQPVDDLAATDLWLDHPSLVTCPGQFCQADDPTDADGYTTFSGTILAGLEGDSLDGIDCDAIELGVYVLGIYIGEACIAVDSPDLNGSLTVTVSDFGKFVQDYNCEATGQPCDPCHDYDESGNTNITDFAIFAGYLNASSCP